MRIKTQSHPKGRLVLPGDATSTTDPNSLLSSVAVDADGVWTVTMLENTAGGDLSDPDDAVSWIIPLKDKRGRNMHVWNYSFNYDIYIQLQDTIPDDSKLTVEAVLRPGAAGSVFSGGGFHLSSATGPVGVARTQGGFTALAASAAAVTVCVNPTQTIGKWNDGIVSTYNSSGTQIAKTAKALNNGGSDDEVVLVITVGHQANNTGTQIIKFKLVQQEFFALAADEVV